VPGIRIADGAEFLVVAAQESRAGTDPGGSTPNAQVQLEAKLHHGVSLVNLLVGKSLAAQFLEGLSRRRHNLVVLFVTPRDVEQAKHNSVWIGTKEVVKIATYPLAMDHARNVRSADGRKICLGRTSLGRRFTLALKGKLHRRR
jgi:hypothetical protein